MTERKFIRCVLTDSELIDAYEQELYEQDLREKELIKEALSVYLTEKEQVKLGR